ncbi:MULTISPECIES: hypothetical protein [Pseudomonas]|uniref:Lipoprotein n=1 Tax=Pseudomonas tritici TaxID=2745518 RepID=A0A8H9YR64_9PSED|nr:MULTISPECIES: hypothetical protein [Pseudomonas]MBP2871359.1 hypothetical protein [Pseudomonas sp. SWRI144]QXH83431.1 hypothetical protein HU722_0026245 [Pseudomonas tritici]CRM83815.1 hypothetical protein [Pseudomonas sp. 35 E 8]
MNTLTKAGHYLALLTALLASATWALADEQEPVGDWWIIYGNGRAHQNVMYVADRTSVVRSNHTKGAQLVAVTLVYEDPGKPMIDVYNIEVQCPTRKVRFLNGQSVAQFSYTLKHLKVSKTWQTPKEFWRDRTLAFVCEPGKSKDTIAMGKMTHLQMIQTTKAMFQQLGPTQEKSQMIDDLDDMLGNKP